MLETIITETVFFYLGFLSQILTIHGTTEEDGAHLFNSSLLIPSASQTLIQEPGNYCRELTYAHMHLCTARTEPGTFGFGVVTTKLCGKPLLVSAKTWNFKDWLIFLKFYFHTTLQHYLHSNKKFLPAIVL